VAFQAHRRGFFLSWPLLYAALAYPAAQLAASFAFMALPGALSTAAPLTQTAILAAFLLCLVSALFGGGMIADVDKQQKAQTFFIKTLAADLSVLAAQAKDPGAKKKLEALHETARYSDPVSHAALSALEAEISAKARTLAQLAASGGDVTELCEQTALLLGERNAKCGLK
jgi:hypothetical protein